MRITCGSVALALAIGAFSLAPAPPGFAQEIVKYRTVDGQIGFTADPRKIPRGAKILSRTGTPTEASPAAPTPYAKPVPRKRLAPRPRPEADTPESGRSTAEEYRRRQAQLARDLESAESAWRSTPCTRARRYRCRGGGRCGYVKVRDCSERRSKRAKLDALVAAAPEKLDEIANDCMADDDCSVNEILDEKSAFSYHPPDDGAPASRDGDDDPRFDAVDDDAFEERRDDAFDEVDYGDDDPFEEASFDDD